MKPQVIKTQLPKDVYSDISFDVVLTKQVVASVNRSKHVKFSSIVR